jgi:nucleoside-diphosphate-sugar epimerase
VVTGGSGRVGRHVVRELSKHYDVVNADLVRADGDVPFAKVDVLDLDAVRDATSAADAVCHIAGIDYDRDVAPEEFIRVNVLGSWHVLQAAAENGISRVVLTSSVSACGLSEMRSDWLPRLLPIDEGHECRPTEPYSVSKLAVEQMGASFVHGTDMSVVCLRPVAVVLPESMAEYLAFVREPGRRWLFYYVTVQDVARAFTHALDPGAPRRGVFFLSAADTSLPEPTLEWYAQRVGPLPEAVNFDLYQENPRASVFSIDKARETLGWTPTSDFLELSSRLGPLDAQS